MFKKLTALLFASSLSFTTWAQGITPQQWLINMQQAKDKLNYELSYMQKVGADIDTYRYSHINVQDKSYAHLVTLEGGKEEIVQRDGMISYFHPSYHPFSIQGTQIIDNLPNLINANFDKINQYYDFVNMGRNRVADKLVQTIRIMPKDNFRYQYIAFIDEETDLLLGSDMLDQDGNLLERFRVVNYYIGEQIVEPLLAFLNKLPIPQSLNKSPLPTAKLSWKTGWLPEGFEVINYSSEKTDNDKIESRLYSDGLFSFTIYVSNNALPEQKEQVWKQGSFTIYNENLDTKEVTIIGQLPLATAKRIVEELKLK
ncbi:sigma-E factor regulatory protein RseB [Mannheimia massilioguelmaensis]|uniref:sigma-E factor regulatory protein RseB n=1 Tax=Mannheimia massilioguelmaensis TaxID=1604354 RepID=UPI0005C9CC17|nr:sigma-E factor regulatory protein RseB [Mannheimia massilioguelmaensis]